MTRLLILIFFISGSFFAQQVSDYYPPPNVGDYWIHHADTFMGESNPYTTIEEVEGIDRYDEQDYYRYKVKATTDSDGSEIMHFYSWINDGGEGIAVGDGPGIDSAQIFDTPLQMNPPDMSVGESWNLQLPGSEQKRIYYLDSFSESVSVPVGDFENCMKFIVTVEDNSGDTLAIEDYYYAEGIGRVLLVSSMMGTSELNEYSVGGTASYDTLYVGPSESYTTIVDAVVAANERDLIIVKDGSYADDIMVDKSLKIKSENGFDNVFIDGIIALSADNITISGLTFSELKTPGVAVLNNSSGHLIENNFFHAREYSIDIHDESSMSNNIHVKGNTIEADSGDGITLIGNFHTVEENTITGCRGAGIVVLGSTSEGVLITHNYIADNGTNAISTSGPVEIIDNIMERNIWAQIFINGYEGTPVLIKYNHINHGISIGIATRGPVVIDDNEIMGNGEDGILVTHSETANAEITNNDIIDNGADGIQARNMCTIENNLVSGSGNHGLYLRELAEGSYTVLNNEIIDGAHDGIYTRASAYFEGNLIEENAGSGVWINWDVENVELINNQILNNSSDGVLIYTDAKLRLNKIKNNEHNGILIWNGEPDLGQDNEGEVGNNTIFNNGSLDLVNTTPNSINAIGNYWGISDSSAIDENIWDNDEADTVGVVNFMPYLMDEPTAVEETNVNSLLPETTELMQAYPNPFNPSTTISYSIAEPCDVTLRVYNNLGEEVVTLVEGYYSAGRYTIPFEAADLSSGIYYYRLITDSYSNTKKIILLK